VPYGWCALGEHGGLPGSVAGADGAVPSTSAGRNIPKMKDGPELPALPSLLEKGTPWHVHPSVLPFDVSASTLWQPFV
jgi:hypothetical protein